MDWRNSLLTMKWLFVGPPQARVIRAILSFSLCDFALYSAISPSVNSAESSQRGWNDGADLLRTRSGRTSADDQDRASRFSL